MTDRDSRALFWTLEAVLLAPLALFWVSVVTDSATLSHLLFGATHTPFRDLLPVMILPSIALAICLRRLRRDTETGSNPDVIVIATLTALSLFIAAGYAVSENFHHARMESVSAEIGSSNL